VNWYKYSKDFSDRNIINHKIIYLENIRNILTKISKLVFQSGKMAKLSNINIISSKKITSYPYLHDILIEADLICLDSPWKFSELCKIAIDEISDKIISLKEERKEKMSKKKKNVVEKGWV
jgi:hypothetical protein